MIELTPKALEAAAVSAESWREEDGECSSNWQSKRRSLM